MPTIKDVAQASGYSVCTVSKALSGKGYIRESTKERILKVVEEIGYHPNHLAVSLKTGRTRALALIVPDVTNVYFSRLEKYVDHYAGQFGYMVYLCNTNNSLEREESYVQNLSEGRVDGVLITTCTTEHKHVNRLREAGIPYVYLNREFKDDREHCLPMHNEQGAYECVSFLTEKGFTRIGGVFQSFSNTSFAERYHGMKRALEDAGLKMDDSLCLFDMDDLDNAHVQIRKLLTRPDRPEAMFAANDMLALSVYQAAYETGLRIPDDLSVVGYDNSYMSDKLAPKLTSYYSPVRESAETAIRYLMAVLDHRTPDKLNMLEGWLVEKESVSDKNRKYSVRIESVSRKQDVSV